MHRKAKTNRLDPMFAPFCPTCGHRMLLGTGRLVAADLEHGTKAVLVRCFCGTILDAFAEAPPIRSAGATPTSDPRAA